MQRRELFNRANHLLSLLHLQVQGAAGLNLLDTNVHAENLYRDFLNLALALKLRNANLIRANFPAIDLADETARVCVQVTSQEGARKVRQTLKSYVKNGLDARFDRLIVLVLGASRSKAGGVHEFGSGKVFDPSQDVWDRDTLLAMLNDMEPELLSKCVALLDANLRFPDPDPIPREVRTIVSLLDYLCSKDVPPDGGFAEAPDPDGKVYRRFAEHSDFLIDRYTDLFPEYGGLLREVEAGRGLTAMEVRRMHAYLRGRSDRRLNECGGNPVDAVSALVREFSALLSRADVDYDEGAVEFFLLAQLIACNVFPNRARTDA